MTDGIKEGFRDHLLPTGDVLTPDVTDQLAVTIGDHIEDVGILYLSYPYSS